jgi:predicted alpha/beta hydrolase family esterase
LAVEALGVAFLAFLLVVHGGFQPIEATVLGLAALLLVYFLFILATFALTWPLKPDAARGRKIGLASACVMIAREWLSFFALFGVIQPFGDTLFSVKRARGRADAPHVILVHGYSCNSALWRPMIGRLRAAGFSAEAIDLEPALASIDSFADQLDGFIEAAARGNGAAKVSLVTHSMGGLVARAYLKKYGARRVKKVVTLACGHHGTTLARLGMGQNARQMAPGSAWLAALPEPAPAPVVSIWAAQDNFIAPQTSARLAGASDVMLSGLGHLTFMFSGRVAGLVVKELRKG